MGSQVHNVEVEATVKVKVKFSHVVEGTTIEQLKADARSNAEKIIGASLQYCKGYRGQQIEPSIKAILDTSASTVNVGQIKVDL